MILKEVNKNSPADLVNSSVELLYLQMKSIGEEKSKRSIRNTLLNSFKTGSNSKTIVVYSEDNVVGICFFNICKGIQSGGNYIWLNEIYVKEEYRRLGYASWLLKYVKSIGKEHNCKFIFAQRESKNVKSDKLFSKSGFDQQKVIWISKRL